MIFFFFFFSVISQIFNVHILYSLIKIKIKRSTHKRDVNLFLGFTLYLFLFSPRMPSYFFQCQYYCSNLYDPGLPPLISFILLDYQKTLIVAQDPTMLPVLCCMMFKLLRLVHQPFIIWSYSTYIIQVYISYYSPGVSCTLVSVVLSLFVPAHALSETLLLLVTVLVTAFLILPLCPNLTHLQEVPSPPCQPLPHPWLNSLEHILLITDTM